MNRTSVTHTADTLCSAVPLSCGQLLTGALEATDALRRTLLPTRTAALCIDWKLFRSLPLTLAEIRHELALCHLPFNHIMHLQLFLSLIGMKVMHGY